MGLHPRVCGRDRSDIALLGESRHERVEPGRQRFLVRDVRAPGALPHPRVFKPLDARSILEPCVRAERDVLLSLRAASPDVGRHRRCRRPVGPSAPGLYWSFETTFVASARLHALSVFVRMFPSFPSSRSTCITTSSFGASVTLTRSYSPIV